MMRKFKSLTALLLCGILILPGCKPEQAVPELIAPASEVQTFRPVERRAVADLKIMIGNVIPREYAHFYTKSVKIKKINVINGEYVEKGTVLAECDIDDVKRQIEDLRNDYNELVEKHPNELAINDYNIKNMQLNREMVAYLEGEEKAKDIDTQIKLMEEDYSYDVELFEYMKQSYLDEIADLNEILEENTLVARVDGYVSFTKDMTVSSVASAGENVVIISDREDPVIEVAGMPVRDYPYAKYSVKYTYIDGVRQDLIDDEYSSQETILSKAKNTYPMQRMKTINPCKLTIGETLVLYYYRLDKENVLAVGKDSTDSDADGNFVYVKNPDGSLEKRYFEPGTTNADYIEVLSGLSEGELVLYEQEMSVPVKYETVEAGEGVFTKTAELRNVKVEDSKGKLYTAESVGVVEDIFFGEGDEVKAGDVLMTIKVGYGKGAMTEADNTIIHLEEDNNVRKEKAKKSYDDMILERDTKTTSADVLETQLKALKKPGENATPEQIAKYNGQKTSFEAQINVLRIEAQTIQNNIEIHTLNQANEDIAYNYNMTRARNAKSRLAESNDGSGALKIMAVDDGTVSKVHVSKGNFVQPEGADSKLITVSSYFDDCVSFSYKKTMFMPEGFTFTIKDEDNTYDCECVSGMKTGKAYASTIDNDSYITMVSPEETTKELFRIKDKSFFKKVSSFKGTMVETTIDDLIIVPGSFVFVEEDYLGDMHTYVWKEIDGVPVKCFVIKGTESGIGNDNEVAILSGVSKGDILVKAIK